MKITVYVQPGAKKTAFEGFHAGYPKVKIAAPPTDNAANNALIDFISKKLRLPKSKISIIIGQTSRIKTLEIKTEMNEEKIVEQLA